MYSAPASSIQPAVRRAAPRREVSAPAPAGGVLRLARRAPWPVILFAVGLLAPPESSVYIAGMRISAYRAVLLVLFLPCAYSLLVSRKTWCDYLVTFSVAWSVLTIVYHHGLSESIESCGIHIVECLGAYLLARKYIRNRDTFCASICFCIVIVIGLLLFTVPEMLTNRNLIRETAAKLIGSSFHSIVEPRYGLYRARGPFQHPILNGIFCGSFVAMAWYIFAEDERLQPRKVLRTGFVIFSAFTSVSSGAIAATVAQLMAIGWDMVTLRVRRRWVKLLAILAVMYCTVDALSNRSGMRVLLAYLTLSPSTAYGRLVIWQWGSAEVERHPILGIGFNNWIHPGWMSGSVDNYWLLIAMRHGLPACLALLGALLYSIIAAGRLENLSREVDRIRRGWIIGLVGIGVAGATVAFWNQPLVLLFFLIGSGGWLIEGPSRGAPDRRPMSAEADARPRR